VAVRGRGQADDHVNVRSLQSDQAGRVYAAVKTSLEELPTSAPTDPMVQLLQFRPGTGAWSVTTIGTLADCHTRPQVVLDDQQQMVHVVATAPSSGGCPASGTPGSIYLKSAPMADPVFPAGRGTPVIRDADSAEVNNATTTKQAVNAGTGLVVLAGNTVTKRYWHADLPLGPERGTVTAGASSTATSTAAATDVTVGRPAGVVTGDVLVAEVNADKAPTMAGVPPGWNPVVAPLGVNGLATTFVYAHVVTDAATEPASYTWRLSTAQRWNGGITAFRGVDPVTPFDTGLHRGRPVGVGHGPVRPRGDHGDPGRDAGRRGGPQQHVGHGRAADRLDGVLRGHHGSGGRAGVPATAHRRRHRGCPLDVRQGRRRRRLAARAASGRARLSGCPAGTVHTGPAGRPPRSATPRRRTRRRVAPEEGPPAPTVRELTAGSA
jgi:hypothetical protein